MRQHLIISWVHLILSVVNFALAAPVVIRERHEERVDVVDVAKDGTAASQTLSQWDPRATSSETNEPPGSPESPEGSNPEPGPNSPSSETGSNHNSPSGLWSSTSSTHFPPGWGSTWASQDAITDDDQLHLLLLPDGWDHASTEANPSSTEANLSSSEGQSSAGQSSAEVNPSSADHFPLPQTPQTPTEASTYHTSDSHSYSTAGSDLTSSDSTSSGSTNSGPTGSDSTGSTSPDSSNADAVPEFLSKLLKGEIKARTSGSRTVNAGQRELQDTVDSRALTIKGFGKSLNAPAPAQ